MNTSYKIADFSANREAEVHRLNGQVELFFIKEFALYRAWGLGDNLEIIDCGCGPGFLLAKIAERLPGCKAVGLECDPWLAELARSRAGAGEKPLYRVVSGALPATGLPANSFDAAIARLVLEHLPDPLSALGELHRILRPGGKLIVVSNDFSLHTVAWPHIAELDVLYQAYVASQTARGGHPCLGRQLPGLLAQAGFASVQFDVIGVHNILESDNAFFRAEDVNIAARLVEEGYLESAMLDTIARKWYAMLGTEGHCLCRQLFAACGVKAVAGDTAGAGSPASLSVGARERMSLTGDKPLEARVVEIVAEILDCGAAAFARDRPFRDLGMDSIAAVELLDVLAAEYGLVLPVAELLGSFTIGKLAALIRSQTPPPE